MFKSFSPLSLTLLCLILVTTSGCYRMQTRPADLSGFGLTDDVRTRMLQPSHTTPQHKPLVTLPAKLVVVLIEGAVEYNYAGLSDPPDPPTVYRLVTEDDFPTQKQLTSLRNMLGVADAQPLDVRALDSYNATPQQMVLAARRQGANVLLVCTAGAHSTEDDHLPVLSVATLGLSPNMTAESDAKAQGVLIDVQTGAILGVAETHGEAGQLANAWSSYKARQDVRSRAQRRALDQLIEGLEPSWKHLVARQ